VLLALVVGLGGLAADAQAQFCVARAEPDGTGGTGRAEGGEGMGGTGAPAPRGGDDGGIGGTGAWAGGDEDGVGGTGIEGAITSFGSVCVNGMRVAFSDDTPITLDEKRVPASRLAVGDVVRIAAERRDGALHARSIELRNEVFGRVDRVDPARGTLVVLGQHVQVGEQTRLGDRQSPSGMQATPLAVGDFVRVSGMRRGDGEIVASRVERDAPEDEVGVTGTLEARQGGGFAVGDLAIEADPSARPLSVGQRGTFCGRVEGGRLVADEVDLEPDVPFDGKLSRLSIEGYARSVPGGKTLELGRLRIDLSALPEAGAESAAQLSGVTLVRVNGRIAPEGGLTAERLEIDDSRGGEARWRAIERGGVWRELRDRSDRDSAEKTERAEREDHGEREQQEERAERPENEERVERPERPEREERVERPERPEREERPERPERPDND
jgi:hypothetical protein